MSIKYNNTSATIVKYSNTELDKIIYNTTTVYQRITVNYYCENTIYKSIKVVTGNNVDLSSSNAASKSGWTFLGWRLDKTASSSVQSSITAGTTDINLYAVYRQSITVTYYNNSTSASSTSKDRLYNNGNIANPSFTLAQASRSGWTARGWSTSTAANGAISYNNNTSFTRDSNITLYGMYQKTVTLSYNGNGATGGSTASQSGTAYYNSNGSTSNPSFSLRSNGFSRTNYKFVNWRMGSASGTAYNAGASVTLSSNTTFYAYWQATVIRAYTFSRDSDHVESDNYNNSAYIQFGNCGYVGTGMSIQNDSYGRSIRLVTSRSGTLRFVLYAQNYTSAGLSCKVGINIANKFVYEQKINANQSATIDVNLSVASGVIVNIANIGDNANMYIKAGSHIDWV